MNERLLTLTDASHHLRCSAAWVARLFDQGVLPGVPPETRMTAQNSVKTAGRRMPLGRPFRPGQSGNPGGRPKGLMEYVRTQTKDGKEVVDLLLRIMRGEPWRGKRPTVDHRIAAAKELLNRGWGRVPELEDGEVRTFTLLVKKGDDY